VSALPQGGVPLDGLGRVAVKDVTVFPTASVTIEDGGCGFGGMQAHLRVIDLPNAHMYLVPMSLEFCGRLATQIDDLVGHLEGKQ
jgi:hypothetical protein